jgi:hypothetical protein
MNNGQLSNLLFHLYLDAKMEVVDPGEITVRF